ncbi:homoserine O-succinyltransferase [Nocardia sp. NPDC006630]|uniref:homoserine O-acetyltransferase/O-succinyltransferase family protein n=1 Tax=Nocardia sp. NPDC006630 TaxID=3157181 RepID=UPI0033A949B0
MVVRVGIVDLISTRPDSMTRRVFLEAVHGGAGQLIGDEYRVETTVFGIDPKGSVDDVDWPALTAMDALIVSGSEPTGTAIGAEPCLTIISRILTECAAATSVLFSCQSAHAALHLLHGIDRHRLPRRQHGVFAHTLPLEAAATTHRQIGLAVDASPIAAGLVHIAGLPGSAEHGDISGLAAAAGTSDHPRLAGDAGASGDSGLVGDTGRSLTAGLAGAVPFPHSRWNAMTSADLRAAGVPLLLDSAEAEWHLATSPDGLHHVFLQGHPEYLCDTMAREYRRDLRRWIADPTLPFPDIPQNYFPADTHRQLLDHAAQVRTRRDPALLDELPLPATFDDVAHSWAPHAQQFFANWIHAIHALCTTGALVPTY